MSEYIYVLGGESDGEIVNTCKRFHIQNLKWETMASMNYPRIDPKLKQCGQFLYVFGGGMNSIERFKL